MSAFTAVRPILPMLTYDDAPAAITFLCEAFGFEEDWRMEMGPGVIGHAELSLGKAAVALASAFPDMGLRGPSSGPDRYSQLQVVLDDVDAHYARAVAAGAVVVGPPEDQPYGQRMYRAVDLEGHRWVFAQVLEDLSPEQIRERFA